MLWPATLLLLALDLLTTPAIAWDSVHRSQRGRSSYDISPAQPQKRPSYYNIQHYPSVLHPYTPINLPVRPQPVGYHGNGYWSPTQRQPTPVGFPGGQGSFQTWNTASSRNLHFPSNTLDGSISAWAHVRPVESHRQDDVIYRDFGGKYKYKYKREENTFPELNEEARRTRNNDGKLHKSPKISSGNSNVDQDEEKESGGGKSEHHKLENQGSETLELKGNSAEQRGRGTENYLSTNTRPHRHHRHRHQLRRDRRMTEEYDEPVVFTLPEKNEDFYRYRVEGPSSRGHHEHRAPGYRPFPGKPRQDDYQVNFLGSDNYYKYTVPSATTGKKSRRQRDQKQSRPY